MSRKQNSAFIQTLFNRYRGFKSQYVMQKQQIESNKRQADTYRVEIYKKYSIPFACVVFVLIGAPLGIITKRGGFGVAAGMSLGFFLLYWACLIGGEKLADREFLIPFLSMWMANILLGIVGLFLTFRNTASFKLLVKKFSKK
jgi:lipopolysaccharide export system permease protein